MTGDREMSEGERAPLDALDPDGDMAGDEPTDCERRLDFIDGPKGYWNTAGGFRPMRRMTEMHLMNALAWLTRYGLGDTEKADELRAELDRRAQGGTADPPEATARARELVAAGYESCSRKYRIVARLPEGKTGLEALREVDPQLAAHFLENANRSAKAQYLRCYAKEPERLELSAEEYAAFRAAGGQSA